MPSATTMNLLRTARSGVNPILRASLGRVPRKSWPGRAMNYLGCGAPIMVGKGETVFLCGIFQESTVLDFAATVGPTGRVVVVEANPQNTDRLRRNITATNVTIENRAVWNTDEDLEFMFAPEEDAQHYNRVSTDALQPFPTHMVKTPGKVAVRGERIGTTMDRLGIERLDHLNLTVNGAELAAFDGASGASLSDRVDRVYAHTELPDPGQPFAARLQELGYRTRMSEKLTTRNPAIDLRRLYAWRP